MRYVFAVITRVPNPDKGEAGNLAMLSHNLYTDDLGVVEPACDPAVWLSLRQPVFFLGEVLILDEASGREPYGLGRKPAKWSVSCEHFDSLDAAGARANEVLNNKEAT